LVGIKAAAGSESNRATQTFRISFSEPVRNVDASDFRLSGTGTATGVVGAIAAVSPVNGAASNYDLTVNEISGLGRLQLDLKTTGTAIEDAQGNPIALSKSQAGSIEVDRVGAISTVATDDLLSLVEASNPNGLKVKGTVSQALANQQLDLLVLGTLLVSATVQSDGSWSAVVPTSAINGLSDGPHTLSLSNNQGPLAGGTRQITIDRVAPTLSHNTSANPFSDALLNRAETADGLTIKGTTNAQANQSVDLRLGDLNTRATVQQNGTWEAQFTSTELANLRDGSISLGLEVSDLAGNRTSADHSLTLDTTALVNLAPISSDGWINIAESSQALTISGVVEGVEDGRTVNISVGANQASLTNPYTATITGGAFSRTITASDLTWTNGTTYQVSVSGTDLAGNSFSDTKAVTADLTPPTVALKLAVGSAAPLPISDSSFTGAINTAGTLWCSAAPPAAMPPPLR
jgi:hypothetical protein